MGQMGAITRCLLDDLLVPVSREVATDIEIEQSDRRDKIRRLVAQDFTNVAKS